MKIRKPALNLRAVITRLTRLEQADPLAGLDQFDFGGDGSNPRFTAPHGYKPFLVFSDGGLQREGTAEDYTLSFDGHQWSTVFAVAPGSVDVTLVCRRVK